MRALKNQQGAISLLSITIFSLLLVVIVVAMTTILIGVQRQSTNDALSLRAYYAAEAGVEDAVKLLKSNPSYTNSSCTNGTVGNDAYVCQTVTQPNNAPNGYVDDYAKADEVNQYEINATNNVTSVKIEWHQNGASIEGSPLVPPAAQANQFLADSAWNWPAAIEVTDAAYKTTQSGDPNINTLNGTITSVLPLRTTIVAPGNPASGSPTITSAGPSWVLCTSAPQNGYNCRATITGFDSTANHIIRVKVRYKATHFRVTVNNSSGPIAAPIDNKVTIDVTAKAGDVLRRVTTRVTASKSALSGLDYALFGDTSICKGFTVTVNGSNETANQDGCPLN